LANAARQLNASAGVARVARCGSAFLERDFNHGFHG
jgi:hypothetical protein